MRVRDAGMMRRKEEGEEQTGTAVAAGVGDHIQVSSLLTGDAPCGAGQVYRERQAPSFEFVEPEVLRGFKVQEAGEYLNMELSRGGRSQQQTETMGLDDITETNNTLKGQAEEN